MTTPNTSTAARPRDEVDANVDPSRVEHLGWVGRLLARLRGEQTLDQLRKAGLRAEPPVRFSARSFIDPAFIWAIEIGAYSVISTDVRIFAHDASIKRLSGYTEVRPVTIGKRCYIGAGATILPGTTIGDEAIIGAGAVVRGEIPAGSVAVGCPAKVIADIEDLRNRHVREMQACGRFDLWPEEIDAADIGAMRQQLDEHGRLYIL